MDISTISTLISILMCVIGIATFVTGMITRAKSDGELTANIKFCAVGIDELKKMFNELRQSRNDDAKELAKHAERLDVLEKEVEKLRKRVGEDG